MTDNLVCKCANYDAFFWLDFAWGKIYVLTLQLFGVLVFSCPCPMMVKLWVFFLHSFVFIGFWKIWLKPSSSWHVCLFINLGAPPCFTLCLFWVERNNWTFQGVKHSILKLKAQRWLFDRSNGPAISLSNLLEFLLKICYMIHINSWFFSSKFHDSLMFFLVLPLSAS